MTSKSELMLKLKSLAERGSPGEAENAEKMLGKLCEKYAVDINRLGEEESEKDYYYFKFKYPTEKRLLVQIFFKVLGDDDFDIYARPTHRKELGVLCTKAKSIEIEILYDFYQTLFAEELEMFILAFYHKHEIFAPKKSANTKAPREMSREETLQLMAMMSAMKDDSPLRRICTSAGGKSK